MDDRMGWLGCIGILGALILAGEILKAIYKSLGPVWIGIIFAVFVGAFLYLDNSKKKNDELRENARRIAEKNAESERIRLQNIQYQEQVRNSVETLRNSAIVTYEKIPTSLLTAEELLDVAEKEFECGAFTPFWEAIEASTEKLGGVNEGVERIRYLAASFTIEVEKLTERADEFPIDVVAVKRLGAADLTHSRLHSIVRAAQMNFQFATIFEQRRNTQVLIAGFNSLSAAIDGLGSLISTSLHELSHQVREMDQGQRERHSEVISSLSENTSVTREAAAEASKQRDEMAASQAQSAASQVSNAEKQLAMLDNIQRRRKPEPSERGPRTLGPE